ncbi:MAG TPA: hypothetical protein VNK43_11540 [Gemmatimonadales bacterium]|nr:hypothetical protein [Gemmatimonadales bacterium]
MGPVHVARHIVGLAAKLAAAGVELRLARVNGRTGILALVHGRLLSVTTFQVEAGRIARVFSVLNPAKLPPIA